MQFFIAQLISIKIIRPNCIFTETNTRLENEVSKSKVEINSLTKIKNEQDFTMKELKEKSDDLIARFHFAVVALLKTTVA